MRWPGERGAYRLDASRSEHPGPGDGAGDPGRPHRPARRRRRSACSRRPRSSARTCRSRCSRRSPSSPDDQLRRGLAHLQAAEFLYETRLFPDLEYTFKHALTHDVAYGSLLHERRRALHAPSSRPSSGYAGTGRPSTRGLAHHARPRGDLGQGGGRYLRQAGVAAYARGAVGPSVERIEQAIELLPRLPASADNTRRAIDVRLSCTPLLGAGADRAGPCDAARGGAARPRPRRSGPPHPGAPAARRCARVVRRVCPGRRVRGRGAGPRDDARGRRGSDRGRVAARPDTERPREIPRGDRPARPHRRWPRCRSGDVATGREHSSLRRDVRVAGVVSCGPREVRGGPAIRGPRRRVRAAVLAPPDAGVRRQRPRLHRCLSGTVRRGHSPARAGPA